jgi:hypothetical protein
MPTIVTRPSKYRSGTLRVLTSVALIASVARRLSAQTPDSTQFRCDGKTITAIDIQPHPPAVIGDDPSGFRRAVQHFLFQSGTTRERAIRPFILARVGQKCEDSRLPEIARVVREQPYIASVTLRAVPDGGDGVRLVFATVDEVPVIIGGGLTKSSLSNLKYGNSNIGGNGLLMSGQWRDGRAYRDALALTMRQYGLFDQPIIASLDALRSTLGGNLTVAISRPFLSDLQHIAWYAGGMHDNSYRAFVRESGPTLSLPIKRDIWAMGAVARYGWRGGGAMIGPVATYEKSRPATEAVIASDAGVIPADTSILNNLYPPFRTFRVGVAGGLRWLNYMHVTGFDALIGEQDVGRGFQVAGTVERGLSAFSATNKSSLVSIDVYTGAGTPKSFVGLAARAEELPAGGGGSWSAAVVSGRTAWYFRPSDRRTIEAELRVCRRLAPAVAAPTLAWRQSEPVPRLQRRGAPRRPALGVELGTAAACLHDRPIRAMGNGVVHRTRKHVVGRRAVRRNEDAREHRRRLAGCRPSQVAPNVARGYRNSRHRKRAEDVGASRVLDRRNALLLARPE